MHSWEKVKRFLGFDKHFGPDKSVRRPPAEQFQKLAKAGIQVEDHIDDGIPLKSAQAEESKIEPANKTVIGTGTIIPEVSEIVIEDHSAEKQSIPESVDSPRSFRYSVTQDPFIAQMAKMINKEGAGNESSR